MPLNKTITSSRASEMFETQTETTQTTRVDVSADYKLVTTTTPFGTTPEYMPVAEAPTAGSFTVDAGEVGETYTKTITVEDLAANTIVEETVSRLEDGVVVSSTTKLTNGE